MWVEGRHTELLKVKKKIEYWKILKIIFNKKYLDIDKTSANNEV